MLQFYLIWEMVLSGYLLGVLERHARKSKLGNFEIELCRVINWSAYGILLTIETSGHGVLGLPVARHSLSSVGDSKYQLL